MKPRTRRTLIALSILSTVPFQGSSCDHRQMIYPERRGATAQADPRKGVAGKAPDIKVSVSPGSTIPAPSVDVPMLDPQGTGSPR